MSSLLIIFAKEPVPGQVKTRLCPPLNPEAAAALAGAFLQEVLEESARLQDMSLALAYSPPEAVSHFQQLAPAGTELFPQTGNDLGERMSRAFDRGFAAGFTPVLLRGSDSPDLPGEVLFEANKVLASGAAEVVLGPSHDGGYYLVGLRRPQPELFRGQAWSTAAVLAATLARARALSLPVHLLPPWTDIDTYDDLVSFLSRPHFEPHPGWRSHRLARQLLSGLS